jgi:sensor histidine kinase YesM
MNPHFIYNSLSSIQSFVYSDDKDNAIKYLDSFSELTRKVLELSNHETILLSEEIQLLETYISLEKMRFGDSFHYTITCDSHLDTGFVQLPSMIIQPFVENAIKHGLLHRKGEKQLNVFFAKENDTLRVTIDDNGVGRKISQELNIKKNKSHQSFSINANKKRLELLNAKKKNSIALSITDKTDEMGRESGTTVTLTIPTNFS